jgi:pimeloyl-ACP methyl ester carboxylesterase
MRFPMVTIRDDVAAQHRLLTEELGVRRLALVIGFSMGAQQAYQWAVSHPDMVDRIAPFCGTARTTPHNAVFLEGARAALIADAELIGHDYEILFGVEGPPRANHPLDIAVLSWKWRQIQDRIATVGVQRAVSLERDPSVWKHRARFEREVAERKQVIARRRCAQDICGA